jgi:hypothetical protein
MATFSSNGTTKQKPRLDLDGRSTSEKTHWCYVKYFTHNCHSRLHTCIIQSRAEHTSKTDGTAFDTIQK